MSEQTSPPQEAAPASEQPSNAADQGLTGTDPSVPVPTPPAPPVPADSDTSAASTPEPAASAAASANSTTADLSNLTQTVSNANSSSASKSLEPSAAESSPARSVSAKSHKSAASHKTHASSTKTPPTNGAQSRATSSHRRKRQKLGELDLATAKIGFIGAGKMAESTINGLIHYAKVQPGRIHVAAPSSKNLERFKTLGCRVTKRNYDIFGRYDCDIVFLCFHGYVIKHCYKLGGARPHPLTTNYIPHQRHPIYILSLVSGVSLSQIKACLLNPESTSRYTLEIHRIMMNTAVGHGLGICAIDCEPDSKKLSPPLRQLLSSIAQLENVPASQMDAACAIGGSGLAFSYYFINALADGAFKMGLSRQQAIRFASKTAQCAAQTMLESGKHPAELRDNVSSPSGAAIYGIHVLEKNDVASGVTAAVEAAHKRANDLATQEVTN